jgi:glutaredoxin
MLTSLTCLLTAALSAATPNVLDKARADLAANRLDDVVLDIQDAQLSSADEGPAADLLAEASERSTQGGDKVLALQFAQMALRIQKNHPRALELAARSMLADSEFGLAEQYAERWIESTHRSPSALLFRAKVAVSQGEWSQGQELVRGLNPAKLRTHEERKELAELRATSQKELAERKGSVSRLKNLEALMDSAAKHASRTEGPSPRAVVASASSTRVIVYGTAWCGYCKKARQWLTDNRVVFEDRDVEKEPDAAREIAEKAANAHVRVQGVPIIDFDGEIIAGYSAERMRRLLARR